jgi:hypothetical protein
MLRLEGDEGVDDERNRKHEGDNALDPKHQRGMLPVHRSISPNTMSSEPSTALTSASM